MKAIRICFLLTLASVLVACEYNIRPEYTTPTPVTPIVTTPVPVVDDVAEFRVTGDITNATIQVSNTLDGLSQVTAVLPYTQTLSIAGRDSVFLSLSARGSGASGFIHAAILVNGILFREASSAALIFNPYVTVSGTWRRAR